MKERIDDLNLDGLKLYQDIDGYTFTSDAVLLANFVKTKKSDVCVEIGTGSGIISILVNYKENPHSILAYEIQESAASLAKRNVILNNMQEKITIICDRVQNWKQYQKKGSVDVVFCNPPYFKYDNKVCGNNEQKTISRFDKYLTPNELFETSAKLLKFGGKLFFINDSSRLDECFNAMKDNKLTPKKMYFVHPNASKNSSVFLCEAVKGGKQMLKVMPPLFTNNLDGDYIQTIQKLYKGR